MHIADFQIAMAILAAGLQALLATHMARRGYWRHMPAFFAYTGYHVIRTGVLMALVGGPYARYFYAYWVGETISIVLGMLAIREVFLAMFTGYEGLRELSLTLFRWSVMVLALVGVLVAAATSGRLDDQLLAGILATEQAVRVVQLGTLLLVIFLSEQLGLTLRHHAFGIALGFGIYAATELALSAFRARLGPEWATAFSIIRPMAYSLALMIWVVYLVRVPAAQPAPHTPERVQLREWNATLEEVLRR